MSFPFKKSIKNLLDWIVDKLLPSGQRGQIPILKNDTEVDRENSWIVIDGNFVTTVEERDAAMANLTPPEDNSILRSYIFDLTENRVFKPISPGVYEEVWGYDVLSTIGPGKYIRDRTSSRMWFITGEFNLLPLGKNIHLAGGDLKDTYPNPKVKKIQGNEVVEGTPTEAGNVLRWNTTINKWEPGKVSHIQGKKISDIAPTITGQILTWNQSTSEWKVTTMPSASRGTLIAEWSAPGAMLGHSGIGITPGYKFVAYYAGNVFVPPGWGAFPTTNLFGMTWQESQYVNNFSIGIAGPPDTPFSVALSVSYLNIDDSHYNGVTSAGTTGTFSTSSLNSTLNLQVAALNSISLPSTAGVYTARLYFC